MGALELQNQTMPRLKQNKRVKRDFSHGGVAPPNLPDDVLETIFSFLPVKNAMEIGILSKRFKNSWLQSRRLIFDKEHVGPWEREKVKSIVSKVFDLYEGPNIQCFKLYFDLDDNFSLVESWIKKCIERGVEELDLDFFLSSEMVKLSYGIFDIPSLKTLKLTFCHLDLPPKLKGLNCLNTLVLRRVHVTPVLVDTILSNCLSLETLDLVGCYFISTGLRITAPKLKFFKVLKVGNCSGMNLIDINAPTLHSFHYHGNILGVFRVANVEKLNQVLLNFKPSRIFTIHCRVANLVHNLCQVSVLTTTCTFLEGLSSSFILDGIFKIQFCFWNLKELQLLMEGANFCNMYDIISFIRHCPVLEKFFLDLGDYTFECGEYWKLHQQEDFENCCDVFNYLKVVKIKGFKNQKLEIMLVRYFLKRANQLENLVLVIQKCNRKNGHYQEFLNNVKEFQSWRGSPWLRIAAYQCYDDKSNIHPTHSHSIWD